MVPAAVDSTVPLVRFFLLMAPRVDERFRFADVRKDLERNIADFLSTEASTLYSQGFSTIPCVISAFARRGDNCRRPRYRFCYSERPTNFALCRSLIQA